MTEDKMFYNMASGCSTVVKHSTTDHEIVGLFAWQEKKMTLEINFLKMASSGSTVVKHSTPGHVIKGANPASCILAPAENNWGKKGL
jgi:hypothetical protein